MPIDDRYIIYQSDDFTDGIRGKLTICFFPNFFVVVVVVKVTYKSLHY